MKKIAMIVFCLFTFAAAQAGGNKIKKEEPAISMDITIDSHANVLINGKINNRKEIEDLINECMKKVTINMTDESGKRSKDLQVSLTVKEK